MIKVIRAEKLWQRAGVYYVRTQAMVKGFDLTLDAEFDTDTPETKYILALDNNIPIGTCRMHIISDSRAKIERVAVVAEYRKKGIGRKVMEAAEEWLREQGIKQIIITSRVEALDFYEALGYTADYSTKEFNGVFDIIHTEKQLS